MKTELIRVILDIYKKYGIRELPFDVFDLARRMGYDTRRYSNLPEAKRQSCMELSHDAVTIGNTIYYNDKYPSTRIRFTLAHELGHIILHTEDEDLADAFAGALLAPRPMVIAYDCKTADDIKKRFNISISAANRAIYLRDNHYPVNFLEYRKMSIEMRKWFGVEPETPPARKGKPVDKRILKIFETRESLGISDDKAFEMFENRRLEEY